MLANVMIVIFNSFYIICFKAPKRIDKTDLAMKHHSQGNKYYDRKY